MSSDDAIAAVYIIKMEALRFALRFQFAAFSSQFDTQMSILISAFSLSVSFCRYNFLFLSGLLQVDGEKAPSAAGSQATPAGMKEVSEEDDLQAAEEVNATLNCYKANVNVGYRRRERV